MGIYIPGMELPENCICCDLSHENGWCPAKQTYTDSYTFKTCPLVHVPPHGRCVDADALIADNAGKWTVYDLQRFANAPTIIPAEPAREEKN